MKPPQSYIRPEMTTLVHLPAAALRLICSFAARSHDVYLTEVGGAARLARFRSGSAAPRPTNSTLRRHIFRSTVVVEDVAFSSCAARCFSYVVLDLRREALPLSVPRSSSSVECALISVLCSSYCVVESCPAGFTLLCRGAKHDGHMLRWLRVDRERLSVGVLRELFVAADDSLPLSCWLGVLRDGQIQLTSVGLRDVTTLWVCGRSGNVLSSVTSLEPCLHFPLAPVGLLALLESDRVCFTDGSGAVVAALDLSARDMWVARGDLPDSVRVVLPLREPATSSGLATTEALIFRVSADRSCPPVLLRRLTLPWPQDSFPDGLRPGRAVQEGPHTSVLLLRVVGGTLMVDVDSGDSKLVGDRPLDRPDEPVLKRALISPVAVGAVRPDPGATVVCAQVLRQQEARVARRPPRSVPHQNPSGNSQ